MQSMVKRINLYKLQMEGSCENTGALLGIKVFPAFCLIFLLINGRIQIIIENVHNANIKFGI